MEGVRVVRMLTLMWGRPYANKGRNVCSRQLNCVIVSNYHRFGLKAPRQISTHDYGYVLYLVFLIIKPVPLLRNQACFLTKLRICRMSRRQSGRFCFLVVTSQLDGGECTISNDCASGNCISSVCCATACTGVGSALQTGNHPCVANEAILLKHYFFHSWHFFFASNPLFDGRLIAFRNAWRVQLAAAKPSETDLIAVQASAALELLQATASVSMAPARLRELSKTLYYYPIVFRDFYFWDLGETLFIRLCPLFKCSNRHKPSPLLAQQQAVTAWLVTPKDPSVFRNVATAWIVLTPAFCRLLWLYFFCIFNSNVHNSNVQRIGLTTFTFMRVVRE